jgi:uroporphyrinogen-III synthase
MEDLRAMVLACIGPITANALRKYGFTPHILPGKFDLLSLAEAIINYYGELKKELKS